MAEQWRYGPHSRQVRCDPQVAESCREGAGWTLHWTEPSGTENVCDACLLDRLHELTAPRGFDTGEVTVTRLAPYFHHVHVSRRSAEPEPRAAGYG